MVVVVAVTVFGQASIPAFAEGTRPDEAARWERMVAKAGAAWREGKSAGAESWTRYPGELTRFERDDRPFRCMSYLYWVNGFAGLGRADMKDAITEECSGIGLQITGDDVATFMRAAASNTVRTVYGERYYRGMLADLGHARLVAAELAREARGY